MDYDMKFRINPSSCVGHYSESLQGNPPVTDGLLNKKPVMRKAFPYRGVCGICDYSDTKPFFTYND